MAKRNKTKNKSSAKNKVKKASAKERSRQVNSTTASIISPWFDFLCVGGVSIVLMLGLLVYILINPTPEAEQTGVLLGNILLLQALINWPHFMASYRLLYTPTENIKKYPSASMVVPAVLIMVMIVAVVKGGGISDGSVLVEQNISYWIWLIAAFYLAWHYTGQAWGMIATFLHLSGIKIKTSEKRIIRGGLRILLVWHVVWGAQDLPKAWLGPLADYVLPLLSLISVLGILSFFLSVFIFWRIKQRTGISPSLQTLAPFLAVYLWYLVLYFEPSAYVYVQLSHALQYLIFPLRVELNRRGYFNFSFSSVPQLLWSVRYYAILIGAGLFFNYAPERFIPSVGQNYTFAVMVASMISIHHYFVDGCIWKIGNPDVRKSLFSHLKTVDN